MKKQFLLLFLLASTIGFAQSINDYKAVIVPLKYEFQKTENQYRLSTITKANLIKAGFEVFYVNQTLPGEYTDRCSVLYADVKEQKVFLATKLFVEFKDCYGKVIYTSEVGKSKEKDFQKAYAEALNLAFESIYALEYAYVAPTKIPVPEEPKAVVATKVEPQLVTTNQSTAVINKVNTDLLYAQATPNGFNLIDSEPKIIMKVYKTSVKDYYTAVKGNTNGVLLLKGTQWFFEYYQNDQLISEKVEIKF